MNYKATVSKLWEQLEDALTEGYKSNAEVKEFLRDYVPNIAWTDALSRLVGREAAAEREHRKFGRDWAAYHGSLSVATAAKLMVLHQIGKGAQLKSMPPATDFLRFRPSAVEAQVVGYLLRDMLKPEWIAEAVALDYSKAVAA
jgi:hypothetical protein